MYHRKKIDGKCSTDAFNGRCKSMDWNVCAQVFANQRGFSNDKIMLCAHDRLPRARMQCMCATRDVRAGLERTQPILAIGFNL